MARMYRIAVITISDRCSRGEVVDRSGPEIVQRLPDMRGELAHQQIVPDEVEAIRAAVASCAKTCDIVLTTGGTGIAARDVTPEAITPLLDRTLPGFGEIMRSRAFEHQPTSVLSRGGAGVCGRALVVWLPGSPAAVRECLTWLSPAIRHAAALLAGDTAH